MVSNVHDQNVNWDIVEGDYFNLILRLYTRDGGDTIDVCQDEFDLIEAHERRHGISKGTEASLLSHVNLVED